MPVSMKGTSMTRYYEKERFSQRLRHAPKLPNSSLFRHRRHHRMHGMAASRIVVYQGHRRRIAGTLAR